MGVPEAGSGGQFVPCASAALGKSKQTASVNVKATMVDFSFVFITTSCRSSRNFCLGAIGSHCVTARESPSVIWVTHRGFPARYSSLLWLYLFVLRLPASIPKELNFLAGVRRHRGDNVLVLVFVHTENHGFWRILIVIIDVEPVALGLGQHDDSAGPQRGHHHDSALRNPVLLRVLVGDLVQVVIGDGDRKSTRL